MNTHSHADDNESQKEYADAIRETTGRIAARGIYLRGDETSSEIVTIEEAVERFEKAVESRGGDLMMDEAPRGHRGEPDDPRFLLPERTATMSAADYVERLALAIDGLRKKR